MRYTNQNSVATLYDGTTTMLSMTTVGATKAQIGDHVELRLKNALNSTVLSDYT